VSRLQSWLRRVDLSLFERSDGCFFLQRSMAALGNQLEGGNSLASCTQGKMDRWRPFEDQNLDEAEEDDMESDLL